MRELALDHVGGGISDETYLDRMKRLRAVPGRGRGDRADRRAGRTGGGVAACPLRDLAASGGSGSQERTAPCHLWTNRC